MSDRVSYRRKRRRGWSAGWRRASGLGLWRGRRGCFASRFTNGGPLKAEEADGTAYADLKDARGRIGAFIEDVYNADRLHSALGYYKSPVAFEAAIRNTADRNQQPLTALSPN